jgi:hypothetical protein
MHAQQRERPANRSYTLDEVEAGMCIWEELDERSRGPRSQPRFERWREKHGTAALRNQALALIEYCDAMFYALPAEEWDGVAYDWDIVPYLLDFVVADRDELIPVLPTTPEIAAAVAKILRG